MFKAIHKMKVREDRGFTLVELLIVVAIIGILAAIAIPQFGAYRRRGYNASANSDLRNIRTTEEAMIADFSEYGSSGVAGAAFGSAATGVGGGGTLNLIPGRSSSAPQTVSLSPNVFAAIEALPNGAGATSRTDYSAVTIHAQGDTYYGADSDVTTLYRAGLVSATTVTQVNTIAAAPDPTPGSSVNDEFTGVTCATCSGPWVSTQ